MKATRKHLRVVSYFCQQIQIDYGCICAAALRWGLFVQANESLQLLPLIST